MSRKSLTSLRKMLEANEKIVALTAYDASFAYALEHAGVDVLLIGDSLGMVVQGQESTIPVSVDEIIYHTANVVRGSETAFVVADLPFMSYADTKQAITNAARLMAEGGAQMVKLEGGAVFVDTIEQLTCRGIPVCAHLGLLPQSVHRLGGYIVQGREQAGADMLVLECVPASLAQKITEQLRIPVIGIGAGKDCDGQVLVVYDMLGLTPGKRPRFSQDFLAETGTVQAAVEKYVSDVKAGIFPSKEQQF